jgi:hypothetical protein
MNPKAFKAYAESMEPFGVDVMAQVRGTLRRPKPNYPDNDAQTEMPLSGAVLRPEESRILIDYLQQILSH